MVSDAQEMGRTLRARHDPSRRLQLDVLGNEDQLSVAPRGFTHGLTSLLETEAHLLAAHAQRLRQARHVHRQFRSKAKPQA
ncbi:hypothetical protein [Xanthomonas graminis]|uniref:hypothetical protein n=1 Tax=Xanthomonas graminis TaxID=3390026 RepID=UPI00083B5810|nr:hypothetical protein [Xanthomonas translucens]